jgi:hypothetical protein
VLPHVATAWKSGADGTAKHAALARRVYGPGIDLDSTDPLAIWLDSLEDEALEPLRNSLPEVAYAYDVATGAGRFLGSNLGRTYPETTPVEFAGTADYVRLEGASVQVVDLKTGMGDVPHPERNAQLRMLALAAARTHGVDSASVGILHAPEGRTPWWSWATLDAFELEVVAGELRDLARRIEIARAVVATGQTPRLTVGEHCAYCPARHGCPARVAMAQRLAGEPEVVVRDLKAMLTPESSALALALWQAATKALQEVGAALYAYASESPIPLGDGRVWGPRETSREVIDAEKAWLVLVEKYGVDVARKAMSLDTSKAGVSRAMQVLREQMRGAIDRPPGVPAGKATLKSLNEGALAALRAAGCVTTKTSKTFEAYQIQEANKAPSDLPSSSPSAAGPTS